MGKLTRNAKQTLKVELNKVANQMLLENDPNKFEELKTRYDILSEMLKPDLKVSPDTLLIVGANLLGIILILKFEQLDIISTKAIGFVLRGRV